MKDRFSEVMKKERAAILSTLNMKAAEMLTEGKITKKQHDMIVAENIKAHNNPDGWMNSNTRKGK